MATERSSFPRCYLLNWDHTATAFHTLLGSPATVHRACCTPDLPSPSDAPGGDTMDFYTLLDHVVDLLRQRQRVTYRALQRQFDLDEETLNDLKDELLYAQQVARDEDGRVLVWTGPSEALPTPGPTVSQPVPPPMPRDISPLAAAPGVVAPRTPEAERRQLTVLF